MKHNKKRNIGIIYELFLRHMSKCIIEDNKDNLQKTTNIISKNFNKKREIYKEFRVFNALNSLNLSSKESAISFLKESKDIVCQINNKRLEKEKSVLIKDINYNIDKNFYYSRVDNYKKLGTIQMLINEWKKNEYSNLIREKELEEKVVFYLLENKKNIKPLTETDNIESSDIVINIMTQKINEKYNNMSSLQKEIIKNYGLYNENLEKLEIYLGNVKKICLEKLQEFQNNNNNEYLSKKINNVKKEISILNEKKCNDQEVIKFLTITELIDELKS
jgi:hypothetical protein